MKTSIKEIIKDNFVNFNKYRKGFLYYTIIIPIDVNSEEFGKYEFPVPIEDCGDGEFPTAERAIMFMRYIRKAIEDGTFVKISS